MKKAFFAFLLGLIACAGVSFAQSDPGFYYHNVAIEKIYRHRLGYVVTYQVGTTGMSHVYIPYSWFEGPNGKADLVNMRAGREWPNMSVFYQNGEFSHVRLYVRRDPSHVTWSVVPFSVDIDQNFENPQDLRLEF